MSLLSSFFRLAAPLSKPHPNPVTGGQYWFHGTGHEFYDDGDPEVPADPGGTLRPPDREAYEYGQHAGEHWNTDLGVHFTSKQRTAEAFATGTGSHAIRPHENSRIAHAKLHMANPKHYDSEHDMAHEAIEWAHKHGHHYLEGSARHEDEWEDHLDQGGYYSEIPDHDHLEYVDAHTTGAQQRRSIDVIDRHHGLEDASGPEKDRYLALHPHREEITSGFKEHLRSQGHDGITYGNEYEPPHGHTCAIPFDHDQINLTHWQWLDPRREHLNRHQEGKEPQPEQKERLFDRNYTPEHGYHWSDQEGKKIGLLQHFGSGTPLYRQPKPDIDMEEHKRLQALDPDDWSEAERSREHQNRWTHETRRALSRGDLEPQEAWNNGYKGHGHDQTSEGARYDDTEHHGLSWEHLPQTLYHVTTNKAGVLAAGSLRSRQELNQNHGGSGLGGGESDTVSFTDDPDVARHIHRALHEYHAVLNDRHSIPRLLDEAKQGGWLDTVHSIEGKEGTELAAQGKTLHRTDPMHHEEARQKIHPEAEPVPGPLGGWKRPDGKEYHTQWSAPMTEEERINRTSSIYKTHAHMREAHGGPMDPGFIMNSPQAMAECHPSQFGILRVHPRPGSRGYRVSALGEWRTADGSVAHIGGLESPHHPEEGPQHTALRVLAKQAKQDSSGYLPNPYHTEHNEWFHGTRHRPGDGEFDDLDPVAMREGHRPPGNGAGGPQMNKLLGVHLSALHDVAHGFADASSDHGKVFHAQLRMKNPIHFEDESSLLRHVWNSTMRDDHFHDEHHDKSLMEWNYGAGATREGINRRLDRAKTAEPGSLERRGPHSSMESYLQFHPRQKEIAEAYVGHLRYEGHDGITYGNNVEGPRLHHCAIAFDKKQIKVTHVDRMHPSGLDDQVERQRKQQWMPTVSHDHIRSIHGEPEDFLHEVERYHSGGTIRTDPGHSYFGPNTGRGDFKFHQAAAEHPDKGDFGTHVTLKDMGITDVGDIGRHPESESMESYGIHWGKDHIAENDYDPDQFDSFHTETVDEPLSNIRYKQGQSHVIHPYVEHLAKVPAHELEPAWAQRMPDGTALLMEGHHRAAAASLRGDTTLKTTVYGKWGPGEREAGHARWKQQHGKTSGLHGDLPEGITYEHRPPNRRHNHHVLIAHHPDAEFESGYENHAGHLTWFEDDGEIGGVDVSEPYQRQGIATALFRRAQEITPSLHHARTLTDEGKAWKQSLGALLPGYVKEHPWLPTGKVFAPGKGCLDARLFDAQHRMRPYIRKTIFDRLHLVLGSLPDWEDWTRVYLAGSEASEWWGNNDFDCLIGVNYARARKAHPEWKDATDDEISGFFNRIFRQAYNDEDYRAPWDGEVWHVTAYVNPDSWDIRRIKPYAAYNMTDHKWAVQPVRVGKDWGPEKWPEGVWEQMEAYLALIEAIKHLPQPEQMRQGNALYQFLHGDRRRAFSDHGTGWNDPGNVLWKALDVHGDVDQLVAWAHQAAKDPGEAA